jgi:hypothetical protein
MKKKIFAFGGSLAVLSLIAAPAFAYEGIYVLNSNHAKVVNEVSAIANTGNNVATGGNVKSSAGDGGSVNNSNDLNEGGAGGFAGTAGDGGNIITGDAIATADVSNVINENCTEVKALEGDGTPDEYSYLKKYEDFADFDNDTQYSEGYVKETWKKYPKKAPRVINKNYSQVENKVYAEALTGDNEANAGSVYGKAGNGGDVNNTNDGNEAGEGGSVGDAGWGGNITTGVADSLSRVVNRINNNITRIRF